MEPIYRCHFFILSLLCLFVPCFCETFEVWEEESVVLPCPGQQDSSDNKVYWCKLENAACTPVLSSTFKQNQTFKPWSTAGVDLINNTSLKIPSVSYSRDNGRFRCRVYPSSKTYDVLLNVLVPVETITVTSPENPVSENKVASFTCLAKGGHPAPVFKWSIDNTPDPVLMVYKQDDHSSNVTFTATRILNNKTIKCEASVRNNSVFDETTIYVTYKPTVSIVNIEGVTAEHSEHSEGDSFDLFCLVESNPPADVAWSFKTKTVNNNVYRITNFDQSQTGTYECSAKNREGGGKMSIFLTLNEDGGMLAWFFSVLSFVTCLVVTMLLIYVLRKMKLKEESHPANSKDRSPSQGRNVTTNRNLTGHYAKIWFGKRVTEIREVRPQRERTEYATIDFVATALLAQKIREGKVKNFQEQDDDNQ